MFRSLLKKFANGLEYNTVQIVKIKNTRLCVIHLCLQLLIVGYIIGFVIVFKRGYQSSEPVAGNSALKVKGSAYNVGGLPWRINSTDSEPAPPNLEQVFDSSDLVYPPSERDAVFLTTNFWITDAQTRASCYPGSEKWYNAQFDASVADASCSALCVRGTVVNEMDTRSGGVWTGQYKLLPAINAPPDSPNLLSCFCELFTWCPDESISEDITDPFRLRGLSNWTISIKQAVSFERFDTTTSNHSPKNNPIPPIYTIREILEGAGLTLAGVQAKGATVLMSTNWDCNLDYSVDDCNPVVSFRSLGAGFNFRRVEFARGLFSSRQLLKHYGLRLLVELSGTGSRFDVAALFTNIGAGIGLLAIASLVADFVAVNLLGHRHLYEKAKFRHVEVRGGNIIRGKEETRLAEEALAAAAVATALKARRHAGLPALSEAQVQSEHSAALRRAKDTVAAANRKAESQQMASPHSGGGGPDGVGSGLLSADAAASPSPSPSPPTSASSPPTGTGISGNGHVQRRVDPEEQQMIELTNTLYSSSEAAFGTLGHYPASRQSHLAYSEEERAAARRQFVAAASHPALAPLPPDVRADDEDTGEGAVSPRHLHFRIMEAAAASAALDDDTSATDGGSGVRRPISARLPRQTGTAARTSAPASARGVGAAASARRR